MQQHGPRLSPGQTSILIQHCALPQSKLQVLCMLSTISCSFLQVSDTLGAVWDEVLYFPKHKSPPFPPNQQFKSGGLTYNQVQAFRHPEFAISLHIMLFFFLGRNAQIGKGVSNNKISRTIQSAMYYPQHPNVSKTTVGVKPQNLSQMSGCLDYRSLNYEFATVCHDCSSFISVRYLVPVALMRHFFFDKCT